MCLTTLIDALTPTNIFLITEVNKAAIIF